MGEAVVVRGNVNVTVEEKLLTKHYYTDPEEKMDYAIRVYMELTRLYDIIGPGRKQGILIEQRVHGVQYPRLAQTWKDECPMPKPALEEVYLIPSDIVASLKPFISCYLEHMQTDVYYHLEEEKEWEEMILHILTLQHFVNAYIREKSMFLRPENFEAFQFFARNRKDMQQIKKFFSPQMPRRNLKKTVKIIKRNGSLPQSSTGVNVGFISDAMMKVVKTHIQEEMTRIIGPMKNLLSWAVWGQLIAQFLSIILQVVHMTKNGFSGFILTSVILGLASLSIHIFQLFTLGDLGTEGITDFFLNTISNMINNYFNDQDIDSVSTYITAEDRVAEWRENVYGFPIGSTTLSELGETTGSPASLSSSSRARDTTSMASSDDSRKATDLSERSDLETQSMSTDTCSNISTPENITTKVFMPSIINEFAKDRTPQEIMDQGRYVYDVSAGKTPRNYNNMFENNHIHSSYRPSEVLPLRPNPVNINGSTNLEEMVRRIKTSKIVIDNKVMIEKKGLETDTVINIVVGTVALGVSAFGTFGSKRCVDFMKNYNISTTFKNNLKSNVKEIRELVETVSAECFNVVLSSSARSLVNVEELIRKMDNYIMMPIVEYQKDLQQFYTFKQMILEANQLLVLGSKSDLKEMVTARNLLTTTLLNAKTKYHRIMEALEANTTRQETLLVHIVGEPGHGKTHFVNNWLIPELNRRMQWPDNCYAINFGSQPEFFPIYNGSNVGIFDEFLAMKDKDPLVPHINAIGSQGYCNFPHAQLEHKTQPCNLKVLFLISNVAWAPLGATLMPGAAEAFYSRFHRFHIENKEVVPGMLRKDIPHSPDFAELKIQFCPKPACNSQEGNLEDAREVSKEAMLDSIVDRIHTFRDSFVPNRVCEVQKLGATVDNVAFTILGEPGYGKSVLANRLGNHLSGLLKMPLYNITHQSFENLEVTRPSIIITHDRVTDERAYSNFYDKLPKPSILINTCNLNLSKQRFLNSRSENRASGMIGTIINKSKNYLQQKVVLKGYSQINQEPGFIRRLGITGNLHHMGQCSWRAEETGGVFVANPGFLFNKYGNSEVLDFNAILEEIYTKYLGVYKFAGGIKFIQTNHVEEKPADIVLRCENLAQLKTVVNSPTEVMQAYYNGLKNGNVLPSIKVSERIYSSSFNFTPQMFNIGECKTVEDVKELARRSYSTLRLANAESSCRIIAGTDFVAHAEDGEIVVSTNITDRAIYTHHEIDQEFVVIKHDDDGQAHVVAMWPMEHVINGLENGFKGEDYSPEQVSIFRYCVDNYSLISQLPGYKLRKPHVQIKQVMIKNEMETKLDFALMWKKFVDSVWFKVLIVILSLFVALAFVTMTYSLFSSKNVIVVGEKAENFLPNTMPVILDEEEGTYENHFLTYKINGASLDVTVSGPHAEMVTVEDVQVYIEDFIPSTHSNLHVTSVRTSIIKRSEYTRTRKYEKGKERARAVIKDNRMIILKKGLSDIRKKVENNAVYCQAGARTMYGIGLKENILVTPAHLWTYSDVTVKTGTITRCVKRTTSAGYIYEQKIYPIELVAYEPFKDVAIARVTDKTFENFPSVVQYLPLQKEIDTFRTALVSICDDKNEFSRRSLQSGPVELRTYATSIDDDTATHYSFTSWEGRVKLRNGDCGSPMFYNNKDHPRPFIGFATGTTVGNFSMEGTVLTKELIQENLDKIEAGMGIVKKSKEEKGLMVLDTENPHSSASNITVFIDEEYASWFSKITPSERSLEDTLWCNEKNPNSKLEYLGYCEATAMMESDKHPYKEAEWLEHPKIREAVTELNITNAPSIVGRNQLTTEEVEALPTIGGRKSLIASQIEQYNDVIEWNDTYAKELEEVMEIIQPKYNALYGKYEHRPLSRLEVINGLYMNSRDPFFEQLEGMDLDTSAGHYAKTFLHTTTKRSLFLPVKDSFTSMARTVYDWNYTVKAEKMRARVEKTEDLAVKGARLFTVVQDNLKREVTKAGKIRVFQSMDLCEIMLIRKYYGTLMAVFKANHHEGHCQLGIDPLVEFNSLYKRLIRTSDVGEAGDFKRWDKHMIAPLIRGAMKLITNIIRYSYKMENNFTRRKVADMLGTMQLYQNIEDVVGDYIIHSFCIADKTVYRKHTGNPSGNVLTTIINSVVNDIYHIWFIGWAVDQLAIDVKEMDAATFEGKYNKSLTAVKKQILQWPDRRSLIERINKNTDYITLGDDYLQVIDKSWTFLVNFQQRKKFFMEKFNIVYDTPNKDGGVYNILPLKQLSFLSRTFDMDENTGVVVPRLKISSIHSVLKWTQNNIPDIAMQSLQDMLIESAAYGEEFYDQYVSILMMIDRFYVQRRGKGLTFTISEYARQRSVLIDTIRYRRQFVNSYPENLQEAISGKSSEGITVIPSNQISALKTIREEIQIDKKHATIATMATGTDNVSLITNSRSGEGEDLQVMEKGIGHINPGNVNQQLYTYDLKQQAHNKFWVRNVIIPVNQESGVTLAVIPYGDQTWMSTPMKRWASQHSLMKATIRYEFHFITASTIVNNLIVGMAEELRAPANYSFEQLQLLQWETTNANSDRRAIYLNFATPLNNMSGTTGVGPLVTGVDPNVQPLVGHKVPTLVIKALTGVQNSFANDNVSINVVVYANFVQNGNSNDFYYRLKDLDAATSVSMTGGELTRITSYTGMPMSELLRLPPKHPLNITCDGNVTSTFPTEYLVSGFQVPDATKVSTLHINRYNAEKENVNSPLVITRGPMAYRSGSNMVFHTKRKYDQIMISTEVTPQPAYSEGALGFWMLYDPRDRNLKQNVFLNEKLGLVASDLEVYKNLPRERFAQIAQRLSAWIGMTPGSYFTHVVFVNGIDVLRQMNPTSAIEPDDNTSFLTYTTQMQEEFELQLDSMNMNYLVYQPVTQPEIEKAYYRNTADVNFVNYGTTIQSTLGVTNQSWEEVGTFPWKNFGTSNLTIYQVSIGETTGVYYMVNFYFSDDHFSTDYIISPVTTNTSINTYSELDEPPGPFVANTISGIFDYKIAEIPSTSLMRLSSASVQGNTMLNPNMSVVEFGNTIVPTLTETITQSGIRTVLREPLFAETWKNTMRAIGYDATGYNVRFQLTNSMNILPIATIMYDGITDSFMLTNNPRTSVDNYSVYPRVNAEEVTINNLQIVPKGVPITINTDTTGWITRTVTSTNSDLVFNGIKLANPDQAQTLKTKVTIAKKGAATSLLSIAGGAASGIGQSLTQIYQQSQQYKQMDKMQQASLDAQMAQLMLQLDSAKDLQEASQAYQSIQAALDREHISMESELDRAAKEQNIITQGNVDLEKMHEQDRLKNGYTGIAQHQRNNNNGVGYNDMKNFIYSSTYTPNTSQEAAEATPNIANNVDKPNWSNAVYKDPATRSLSGFTSSDDSRTTTGMLDDAAVNTNVNKPVLKLGDNANYKLSSPGSLMQKVDTPPSSFFPIIKKGKESFLPHDAATVLKATIDTLVRDKQLIYLTQPHGYPAVITEFPNEELFLSVGFAMLGQPRSKIQAETQIIANFANKVLSTYQVGLSKITTAEIYLDNEWKTIYQLRLFLRRTTNMN